MAVAGIVRAQPDGAPKPAAAAPQSEPYVIQPGAESLFADMLGGRGCLPPSMSANSDSAPGWMTYGSLCGAAAAGFGAPSGCARTIPATAIAARTGTTMREQGKRTSS